MSTTKKTIFNTYRKKFMNRIVNDFIMELPELVVNTDKISQEWIDAHKPEKRFAILKEKPTDPELIDYIDKLDKSFFHEDFTYMLLRFGPYDEYTAHTDASRNTGLNLVIRGNREHSPIKYYVDDDLNNEVFTYPYQSYPILMTSQRYHSIKNDYDSERIVFTIHFKTKYTFEGLRDRWLNGEKNLFFKK